MNFELSLPEIPKCNNQHTNTAKFQYLRFLEQTYCDAHLIRFSCFIVLGVNIFAILAHHKPQSLLLLLEVLKEETVYLHIDKSVQRREFFEVIDLNKFPNLIILTKRQSIKVSWGGYSIVQAEIQLIKHIVSDFPSFEKIVFLSGEDYPIRPIFEFSEYLTSRKNVVALQLIRPDESKGPEFIENIRIARVSRVHNFDLRLFKSYKKKNFLINKIFQSPHKILNKLKIPNRKYDSSKRYFVGSQWIAISKSFAELLLLNEESIKNEFRFSFAPDELAFQTIFGRLLERELDEIDGYDAVIDASYHVVPPSFTVGGLEWQLADLPKIVESKKFFVRKPGQDLLNELRKNNLG